MACGDPIGITMPDGRYIGETKCAKCRGEVEVLKLRNAGVPEWFIAQKRDSTIKAFDQRGNASLRRAVEKCNELLAHRTLLDRTWLVLTGGEGSGKSHLAAAVTAEFIHAGRTAQFKTFDEILLEITSAYHSENPETAIEVVRRYTDGCYFLALDDVGVEAPTAHTIQMFYRILNKRLNDKRPTMITTNYPLTKRRDKQPTLGERLSEQLQDDTPVRRILDRVAGEAMHEHLDVSSYRRAKK